MLEASPRLSPQAAAVIRESSNRKLVSAVSAYEVCLKHKLGKWPEAAALAADFEGALAPLDLDLMSITPAHAVVAGKLDPAHRDPFDRLLIAQALVERVPVVSADAVFDHYGVERLW